MESGQELGNDLADRVREALHTALTVQELEDIKDQQTTLTAQFLQKQLSGKEFEEKMEPLLHPHGVVSTASLEEFRDLLGLIGFLPDAIDDIMNDEIPHYEEATRQGLSATLQIQFVKDDDGKLALYPSTVVEYPDSWSDEEQRISSQKIIEAQPNPSPHDLKQLGK